ncbi:uncharacterized protein LOC135624271 [Musa acuminata AAA Group]|uniref:uncharacterized protein LOC135624271 n=1 Tax=Musa acuminata AAA Group TaxID=214697 RepID=UPI0031D0A5A3
MDRNKSFECDHEEIGDGSICTSNIKIGDGSDCNAASGRKLQKLLVEDPMSGPVVKEELGSASATDQQQLPSLDAVDESVVAVVSLAADNVPSPKAVDESMTSKSENSGIGYFKLGDETKEKNSISTSSIDELVRSAMVSLVTAEIASEVKEVHESYPVGSKGQEPPSTSMIKEILNCEKTIGFNFKTSGFNADRRGELASSTESCSSGVSAEPDVISKLEFDLNEGISGVDANEGEPAISTAIVCSSVIRLLSLSPFANPMLNGFLPASITVAAPGKVPFMPPENLLKAKDETGWKVSATTSAFWSAEPRNISRDAT